MKRILLLLNIILITQIGMNAQHKPVFNEYTAEWKEIAQFEKEDLPKSALGTIDMVLKKATAEKNTQQVIKALLMRSRFEQSIDDSVREEVLYDISNLISQTKDSSEKAILHSLLAELYEDYFDYESWGIRNRTNLKGIKPQDIKEWTVSVFATEVKQHLDLSVAEKDVLMKGKTADFKVLIEAGKDSPEFYPTLYDFLMKRAIQLAENMPKERSEVIPLAGKSGLSLDQLIVPAFDFVNLNIDKEDVALYYYQQYLKSLLDRNMTGTIILTEIDKIEFLQNNSGSLSFYKAVAFAEKLIAKYNPSPMCGAFAEYIARGYINNTDYNSDDQQEHIEKVYIWCERAMKDWSAYPLMDNIKQIKKTLETPLLSLSSKSIFYADEDAKVKLTHMNLQSLGHVYNLKLYKRAISAESLMKSYPIKEVSKKAYLSEESELNLGVLPVGSYVLKGKDIDKETVMINFDVTRLGVFSRNSAKDAYDIYVVDRMTGKPIEGASVRIYKKVKDVDQTVATVTTNSLGLAAFTGLTDLNTKYGSLYYTVKYGDDQVREGDVRANYAYRYEGERNKNIQSVDYLSILIDRQIYRPGQTVYYKGIIVSKDKRPIDSRKVEVVLNDASGNKVSSKELMTNEFGSVAGEFVLPQGGLLGNYEIQIKSDKYSNSTWFDVAEYKRPTFEVTFDKIEKTYSFGEEVTVKGYARNFSGVNLQNTKVSYTIKGNRFSFWRYLGDETFSMQGEAVTTDDGSFEIRFTPEAGDLPEGIFTRNNIQQFTVTAEVSDANNETQKGAFSFNVGDVSMLVNLTMPSKIEKSDKSIKLKIDAVNLNGIDIKTSGTYNIYVLDKNDSIATQVGEGSFTVGEQVELLSVLQKLESGKYRVKLSAKDDKGKAVEDEKNVLLFSYNDKKPPIETNEWLVEKNKTFSESNPAEIILGVSSSDVNILYEIRSKDKMFERKRLILSNENKTFTIPYKAEYGEGVHVLFTYMKDQQFSNLDIELTKEVEKQAADLKVKLEVFRDKLRPGQEEIWTLSVKNEKDEASQAEVLASMYDMSLDKLSHKPAWYVNLPQVNRYNNFYWQGYTIEGNYGSYTSNNRYYWWYQSRIRDSKEFSFDRLNLFGLNLFSPIVTYGVRSANTAVLQENAVVASADQVLKLGTTPPPPLLKSKVQFTPPAISADGEVLNESVIVLGEEYSRTDEAYEQPQIRRNFNETAFFYPQLRTNEKGEVQVCFTVPESNTQWRFRALAYDKEMRVGQTEQVVVTRKKLMVTPNLPRFVRQGDKTSISTKISNLSENALTGTVKIEFFDPLTDQLLNIGVANQEQTFSLEKDASLSADWIFDIPADIELIGCRIVASSESFSDGEQHVLSVLPNRMLVTESMPFDVTESEEFVFEKMKNNKSKTLDNYRLTLEYTSNPAWYAVQALPVLNNLTSENAVNWIGAYFVNRLGMSIMKQYPQVGKMIEVWKQQGNSKETLTSKLLKNEELKSVLLSETPWVLDAKDEAEQMERLSLLFDLNNANQNADQAIRKLLELQHESGGWTWYKGMSANRGVTQFMLYCFAKLQEVGQAEYSSKIKEAQMRALKYLDDVIVKDFKDLKKYNKEWEKQKSISVSQLEYLFVRTYYRDIPITKEAREAERFYTNVVAENWIALDLYERSLLVHILLRNGNKDLADQIVKSVREKAIVDKKQGMYWPNNNSRSFGFGIPVICHVFLMDALEEAGSTDEEMKQLTQWMVKQKQTQAWGATPGTMLTIARMLSAGNDMFDVATAKPQIKVGKVKVDSEKADLGTGYIKQVWEKKDIKKDMNKVDVKKENNNLSYGALYWQYYEDLDKITASKTALNVEKELYRKVVNENGQIRLEPIIANSLLKVNDKVTVRLVVRVDRDMDFVHLKDMRSSCFEPINTISQMKWVGGASYYMETRDASTNFYFDHIAKGTYVFEYDVYANRRGAYSNGITTIQALYAPEFGSHTAGISVDVQ